MEKKGLAKILEEYIKILVTIPSVSGNEEKAREFIIKNIKDSKIKYFSDIKGNLIAQKGKNPEKLALVAHMDKEGFMVAGVEKNSLKVVGIRRYPLFKKGFISNVCVVNKKGYSSEGKLVNEKSSQNKLKVYLPNDAKDFEIGDYVTYLTPLKMNKGTIVSSHLDNSMGVAVAIEVINFVKNGTVIFSAQETIGFHGIGPAMHKVKPKKVIVLDATYAHPNPINGASLYLGKGPSICIKDKVLGDRSVISELTKLAQKKKIPVQKEIWEEANSDIMSIHNVGEGIPACFVGLPVKNHGSSKESGSLSDMIFAYQLLLDYFSFVYEK